MSDDERRSDDEVDEAAEAERRRQEAQARMKAAQAKKKGGKKKGLCLTPEKKKLLKQLIMEKAAEEMRAEAKKRAEEKERYINQHVPQLSIDGMDQSALVRKVEELFKVVKSKEEEKYDLELKIRKQDLEINEITSKVNDVRGKYAKPVLKKVTKTEKLVKVEKKSVIDGRASLKSTGAPKYQLDDQPAETQAPDWRGGLEGKAKKEGGEQVNGEVNGEEVEAEA